MYTVKCTISALLFRSTDLLQVSKLTTNTHQCIDLFVKKKDDDVSIQISFSGFSLDELEEKVRDVLRVRTLPVRMSIEHPTYKAMHVLQDVELLSDGTTVEVEVGPSL